MNQHKGWYNPRFLPHYDAPGTIQAITFRLADSLPRSRRAEWEHLLAVEDKALRRRRLQVYLDKGYGNCWLRDPRIATMVETALHHFDGERYTLLAWVIMPNHVHVIIEVFQGHAMWTVVQSWKRYTARRANALLGLRGSFWQKDYWDTFMRDEYHLERAVRYVHSNPVSACLVEEASDWPWSSARRVAAPDALFHVPRCWVREDDDS